MSAYDENALLALRIERLGVSCTPSDAAILRRAQLTLHRWAELECGDGNAYASWSIERDEETGKPYRCVYTHSGTTSRTQVQDKEAIALKRVAGLCKRLGLHFYHQTDPRGCALWVSRQPLDCQN